MWHLFIKMYLQWSAVSEVFCSEEAPLPAVLGLSAESLCPHWPWSTLNLLVYYKRNVCNIFVNYSLYWNVTKRHIQSRPVIPRIVKPRVRLSHSRMMDPRLLDSDISASNRDLTRCKQSWEDTRIQANWRQIEFSRWKQGFWSAPVRYIIKLKARWWSSFSKTWKKMKKYIYNLQLLMRTCLKTMQI